MSPTTSQVKPRHARDDISLFQDSFKKDTEATPQSCVLSRGVQEVYIQHPR